MGAKTAPKSASHKFRVGDPVWVLRGRPIGTHRTKTWFTPGNMVRRIDEDTYRIKVGLGQFREPHESQLRARDADVPGKHVSLLYTAGEADSDDDYAEQDDYTVEKILAQRPSASAPGEWSSWCAGEAMNHPTTPGNPSLPLCRGSALPSGSTSAGTRRPPGLRYQSSHQGD